MSTSNAEKLCFKHYIGGGCGSTEIHLELLGDNTFILIYKDNWMGSDKISKKIKGTFSNTKKNNYYHLLVDSIDDQKDDNGVVMFELFTLNSTEKFNALDAKLNIVNYGNGGIVNKEGDPSFDALLTSHFNDETYGNSDKMDSSFLKMIEKIDKAKMIKYVSSDSTRD